MEHLKKLRLEKGLSQQQLADHLHITQQSVYKYEKGISDPNLEVLTSIADFFGTSVDYLLGRTSLGQGSAPDIQFHLTPQESKHLYMYRQLPPNMKEALDTLMFEHVKQYKR